MKNDNLCVLGLRFSEDATSPRARFDTLRARLGDAFEVIELDSSPGNPAGFAAGAHSLLTNEVREVPGHPTLAARDRVVEFLKERISVVVQNDHHNGCLLRHVRSAVDDLCLRAVAHPDSGRGAIRAAGRRRQTAHRARPGRALGLAANTVAKAYRALEQDEVIETRGRNGSFVSASGDSTHRQAQLAAAAYADRITTARRRPGRGARPGGGRPGHPLVHAPSTAQLVVSCSRVATAGPMNRSSRGHL